MKNFLLANRILTVFISTVNRYFGLRDESWLVQDNLVSEWGRDTVLADKTTWRSLLEGEEASGKVFLTLEKWSTRKKRIFSISECTWHLEWWQSPRNQKGSQLKRTEDVLRMPEPKMERTMSFSDVTWTVPLTNPRTTSPWDFLLCGLTLFFFFYFSSYF